MTVGRLTNALIQAVKTNPNPFMTYREFGGAFGFTDKFPLAWANKNTLDSVADVLKNHLGQRPPVGVEVEVYPLGGRERPTAFWWHATPQKNMVHGLLRT
jgi:hypothetical protein